MIKQFARALMATLLAVLLALGTLPSASAQNAGAAQSAPDEPKPANSPAPTISLGRLQIPFHSSPKAFPNLIAPYQPISIAEPGAANTPKIEQMIHDGKLELTLQDAVELALANNMDIVVSRYNTWLADTDLLKTASGGFGRGTAGSAFGSSSANIPTLSFDPVLSSTISFDRQSIRLTTLSSPAPGPPHSLACKLTLRNIISAFPRASLPALTLLWPGTTPAALPALP